MSFIRKYCLAILLPLLTFSSSLFAQGYDFLRGAVFTQTNDISGNEVLMYSRDGRGRLDFTGSYETGGFGTSAGLGNQGSLVLGHHNRLLFVVNAGSNEISVFRITRHGLKLVDKEPSGGETPVSVTTHQNMLYVLHSGSDSINGFQFDHRGHLNPIANSTRALSGTGTAPAQIQFSPWGDFLTVTEKATNQIDSFALNDAGQPGEAVVSESVGTTPFGFDFDRRGRLIVSEAAGGAADASSMSSYNLLDDGSLWPISSAVATTETAACWTVVSPNGRYAYTTNAGSSSISGFKIKRNGKLKILDEDGVTATTGDGSNPLDMVMSQFGRHLYAISPATQQIVAYKVKFNGGLRHFESVNVPSSGMNGLAGF